MSHTTINNITEKEPDLNFDLPEYKVESFENTVLIVDDEVEILNLMETLLEMNGFKVVRADSGEEALVVAKDLSLAAVVSDYRMPGINGVDLLSRLKLRHSNTPMIIATGFADVDIAIDAINKGGVYKLIKKPWDPFELLQEVKAAVDFRNSEKSRKILAEKLKEQNEILEERVSERTSELNEVITDLQEANETITQTYQHLLQSDKLATLGLMAGTVAHDIANPLTVVMARARLILMKNELNEKTLEDMNIIIKSAKKIEKLIFSITGFAKKSGNEFSNFNVLDVLNESLVMLSKSLKVNSIELIKKYEIEDPIVWGDPNKIEQVFTNIIQNALQAMENNGNLDIEVIKIDKIIRVIIGDSGPGIPANKISEIFEAFYTTKKEGTGLGLNICKRIMEEHDGVINVESVLGEGTQFRIDLPLESNE